MTKFSIIQIIFIVLSIAEAGRAAVGKVLGIPAVI